MEGESKSGPIKDQRKEGRKTVKECKKETLEERSKR